MPPAGNFSSREEKSPKDALGRDFRISLPKPHPSDTRGIAIPLVNPLGDFGDVFACKH